MGKQDDFFRTQIRIPAEIHRALRDEAEESGRSMNAEIVARLEESLAPSAFESAELPSAEHLRAASASALESLRESVWQHATRELFSVARVGKVICPLDLSDVPGFDGDNEEHQAISEWLEERLKEKGFVTSHEEPGEIVVFWGEESK